MKSWIAAALLIILPHSWSSGKIFSAGQNVPGFYNEILKFSIDVKGVSMGNILMRTVKTGEQFLQINTQVESFDSIKNIYYISGKFGAMWDFKKMKSYVAYEDIYDGYTYIRRAYRFQDDNRVFVNKHEVRFEEAGLPHDAPPKKSTTDKYYINTAEYQDLLGVFYTLRSSGIRPKPGDVYKLKILPAGVKKILVIKVLGIKEIDVEALGEKREVVHVKTGIASAKQDLDGGDLFFKVSSPLEMYFTNDEDAIPVRIWAKVPIIQRADVILTQYKQIKKAGN